MNVYDLLIIYNDGAEKVVKGVNDHGINEKGWFYYLKNGYRAFIPVGTARFFGREFDYMNND